MGKPGKAQKPKASAELVVRKRRRSPAPIPVPEHAPQAPTISHEAIAGRAYALFLARGGQPGDDRGDWFRAETELRREGSRG
jgi:hypothetical protein